MLHDATLVLNWVIAHKDALLAIVGGTAGLSITAQAILHKLDPRLRLLSPTKRKAYAYTLVQALTAGAALSAYLINSANFSTTYPILAVGVATAHRFLVSPYYVNKILPYLEYEASRNATGQPLNLSQVPSQAEVTPTTAAASFLS